MDLLNSHQIHGSAGKGFTCQDKNCKRCRFDPWVRKMPSSGKGKPSSILAWRIPWAEEPGELEFIESHRVRHERMTEHMKKSTQIHRNAMNER